ncbi:hypothetical protein BKP35_13225 [Anaerobacillus arseniciselenatis]|uniref:SecDF P1 head subdomain domain-containing protein n=1 Tax=Anaerobacillus arseniciselenatis TaxID=85682 RepID=A0A1S2LGN5_9BACI|nr:hypothetical protein [Anaerobacillus arseniciselenatis]OIJ10645.1 hypothetical protein BKP35_13225 [Anaerobacillus arseniciselenatis]
MKKIIRYLFVSVVFLFFLTGCITSESDEVTIQNEDGEVLATTSDFTEAGLEYQEQTEQYVIKLTFKDENKLEEITESHLGETTKFFLNDELIASPRIDVGISGTEFLIAGTIDGKTAKRFVEVINNN